MSKNIAIPWSFLWHPVHFLALGLGSGMPRFMPGTWGTLAGLLIFIGLDAVCGPIGWITHLTFVLVTTVLGVYLCDKTARDLGVHDHGGIVWDEFVGIWLTLMFVPMTWFWLLAAFLLFRVFDILKPPPIRWIDQKVTGGWGIMLDDLIAAVFAWLSVQGLIWMTTAAGVL